MFDHNIHPWDPDVNTGNGHDIHYDMTDENLDVNAGCKVRMRRCRPVCMFVELSAVSFGIYSSRPAIAVATSCIC